MTRGVRAETVDVLADLNEAVKAQQAFLNSCADALWASADQRRAIRWLLAALIDHRRRIRAVLRLWRTLSASDPVERALVAETTELLDENRRFAPYVDAWRAVATGQLRSERQVFWHQMAELAQCNLSGGALPFPGRTDESEGALVVDAGTAQPPMWGTSR